MLFHSMQQFTAMIQLFSSFIIATKIVLLTMRRQAHTQNTTNFFLFDLKLNLFCLFLKIEIRTRRLYSSITYSSSRLRLLIGGKLFSLFKISYLASFPSDSFEGLSNESWPVFFNFRQSLFLAFNVPLLSGLQLNFTLVGFVGGGHEAI